MADDGAERRERREQAEASQPWPGSGLGAVVIAGAGARGAYEAGALSVLLPALFQDGLADTVLLGTSAGAVNAALWAQAAVKDRSLTAIGEQVCEFWRDLDVSKVFRPIAPSALKRFITLDWVFGRLTAGLDTTPLMEHAARTFTPGAVADNIDGRRLGGLGVVATTCPLDGSGGRSRVFLQLGPRLQRPTAAPNGAIDYVVTEITHRHIIASAAIPALFPAVQVQAGGTYYTDGGVRLNTPLEPALELGATRLAIVSSHATEYPVSVERSERPDVIDIGAQAIHVVLADGLIEDLRTLKRINQVVRQAGSTPVVNLFADPPRNYSDVPFAVVSPQPGELAKRANAVFSEWGKISPGGAYRRIEYELIRRSIAGFGRGAGNDEILSYLLFDRKYANDQIELGKANAQEALRRMGVTV